MAKLITMISRGEITTFSIGMEKGDPTKIQIIACGGAWNTTQSFSGCDEKIIMAAVKRSLALFDVPRETGDGD